MVWRYAALQRPHNNGMQFTRLKGKHVDQEEVLLGLAAGYVFSSVDEQCILAKWHTNVARLAPSHRFFGVHAFPGPSEKSS